MSDDGFEIEEGQEVVRNTIVGGRPRARRKRKIRIPIGIEKLLCRAAADPAFQQALQEDRAATLAELGPQLTGTEAAILASIPSATLAEMILNIDLERHSRRRFMRGVVAATLAAATSGLGALGCNAEPEEVYGGGGIAPDTPTDVLEDTEAEDGTDGEGTDLAEPDVIEPEDANVYAGIPPDPADVVEYQDHMAAGGILPDTK
jgi:hypothetical protein